jgi:hypothetical protein
VKRNKDRNQVFGCAFKSRHVFGEIKDLPDYGRKRPLPINQRIKVTELIGRKDFG